MQQVKLGPVTDWQLSEAILDQNVINKQSFFIPIPKMYFLMFETKINIQHALTFPLLSFLLESQEKKPTAHTLYEGLTPFSSLGRTTGRKWCLIVRSIHLYTI